MKFDFKGIRFSTWLYFFLFSFTMMVVLGFLLVVLIKPYYRDDRIKMIERISSEIESLLLADNMDSKSLNDTARLIMGNNACALIYNEKANEIYSTDSIGQLCLFDKEIEIDDNALIIKDNPRAFIDYIKGNPNLSLSFVSTYTDTEMILYAKQLKANLANYYLIINAPVEPIESYLDFVLNQYLLAGMIVVLIGLIVSIFLARKLSMPIIDMKKEANKLAEGNYDVEFKTDSFSEINDLANTLDDATNKLAQINDLRKDLVANVSHDLRTPLTMIKAYAEMIKDISGDNPNKRNEHLDVILNETDYLDKLVTDMAELSKIQSGVIELNKTNFDLKDATLKVVDLLKGQIDEKQINLNLELVEAVIYADEIKMSQVIYNFLSNSLKYSDDQSQINIRIKADEDNVHFEVEDHGDGIDEKSLTHIWDRYNKVDKNFNRNVSSTGLGLAISKAILESHKAKYGVISVVNEGSTFYFDLSRDYDEEN